MKPQTIGKAPSPRSHHGQTLVKHFLVIYGGQGPEGGYKLALGDINMLDLSSFTWVSLLKNGT